VENIIKISYLSLRKRGERNYKENMEESSQIKKKREKESISSKNKRS